MRFHAFKSKIHRATVTEADLNYEGSVTIDSDLMRAADILPNEQVQVLNVMNGERFETYAIPAPPGSGVICLNGPAARLAHVGDLLDWGLTICDGEVVWREAVPASWDEQVERFFAGLRRLDERIASAPLRCTAGALFQGPIADAFTHVGQLNMMRRLAGSPVRGESYYRAEIVPGRVGAEQAAPRREFD